MSVGMSSNLPVIQWKNVTDKTIRETSVSYASKPLAVKVSSGTVHLNESSTILIRSINTNGFDFSKLKEINIYEIEGKKVSQFFAIQFSDLKQDTFRFVTPPLEDLPSNYTVVLTEGKQRWMSKNLKVISPEKVIGGNKNKPNQSDPDSQPSKKTKVAAVTDLPFYSNVNNNNVTNKVSKLLSSNSQDSRIQSLLPQGSSKQETSAPVETQPASLPSLLIPSEHFFAKECANPPSPQKPASPPFEDYPSSSSSDSETK